MEVLAPEDVPVEMEDGLPGVGADVDLHLVVLEPGLAGGFGDELEHPLALGRVRARRRRGSVDVVLGDHEQVHRSLRVDVRDRDEPLAARDDGRPRGRAGRTGSPHAATPRIPSSLTRSARTRTSSPTGASRGKGE